MKYATWCSFICHYKFIKCRISNVGWPKQQCKVEFDILHSTKSAFDFVLFIWPGLCYYNNSKKFWHSTSLNPLLLHCMTISVIQFFVLITDKIWYNKISKRQKIDIVSSSSEKDQVCKSALSVTPHPRDRGNISEKNCIVDWTLCCLCQEQTNDKLKCSTTATSSDPQSAYQELADKIKTFQSIEICASH